VIPEADVWRAALAMLRRYKDDAMFEAAARADQLLRTVTGRPPRHRILDANVTNPLADRVHGHLISRVRL
jgi:hypothetical protein